MPQNSNRTPVEATPAHQVLERIATGLQAARLRAGLDEQRVVDLLAKQGFEITTETLKHWEETGLVHVDAAVHLAEVYGATIDTLAGRRAYAPQSATDGLPPTPRSAW
jgi:hypothetical protein